MKSYRVVLLTSAAILALSLAGCDMSEPEVAAAPADEVAEADAADVAMPEQRAPDVPVPAAARPGVPAEKLEAGQRWLASRIVSSDAPEQPFALQADGRYLLHPGDAASARLVIDVAGTESLVLQPMIESFAGNDNCTNNPDAGVVDLRWSLDGGDATTIRVDRFHDAGIAVSIGGAKQLEIEVLKGNDVIWCDWFALGVSDVAAASAQ